MANFGQATFVGSEVVIECGDKMNCCEREQAQAKVKGYNDEIAGKTSPPQPGPLQISPPVPKSLKVDLSGAKCTAQAEAWRDFRQSMNNAKTPADRKKVAQQNCMSPCLADQVANSWKPGKDSSSDLGVQMDHTIEVKWGGAAGPIGLTALGSKVNNFFGSIAKRTGDDMCNATPPQEEISAVHFVCNPPCNPPHAGAQNNNYSTGPGTPVPSQPPTPNPVRTYLAD